MSLTIDSVSLTPNPVNVRGSLTISAAVTEAPDTPSAELLVWLDASNILCQSSYEMMRDLSDPPYGNGPYTIGMWLYNFEDVSESGYRSDALHLDGVDDYGGIYIDDLLIDTLTDWTVELLIRKEGIYEGYNEPILNFKAGNGVLTLLHSSGGGLMFEGGNYSFAYINDSEPMHLCMTRSAGSDYVEIYINGWSVGPTLLGDADRGDLLMTYPIYVGTNNQQNAYANMDFMGLRIYNGVLSADEVYQKYQAGMRVPPPAAPPVIDGSLFAWFDLTRKLHGDPNDEWYSDDYVSRIGSTNNRLSIKNLDHTPESGFDKNGVNFDGIDDAAILELLPGTILGNECTGEHTIELAIKVPNRGNETVSIPILSIIDKQTGDIKECIKYNGSYLQFYGGEIERSAHDTYDKLLHIALAQSASGYAVYLNGELQGTVDTQHLVTQDSWVILMASLDMESFLKATLYTVRYYTLPLTETEIKQNYASVQADIEGRNGI